MSIDIHNETLVAIRDVPKHVPRNSLSGKQVNIATVWRWVQRGCRTVKLETALIGGNRHTSLEALQRFSDRVTASADGATNLTAATPAAAQRSHHKACRELDEAGIR